MFENIWYRLELGLVFVNIHKAHDKWVNIIDKQLIIKLLCTR